MVGPPSAPAATPPGLLRRAAAGAWHVPAAFAFLLRRPRLLPLALGPSALAAVFVAAALMAGMYLAPTLDTALSPDPGHIPAVVAALFTMTVWAGTLTGSLVLGLALALLLSAPVLDRLSRETEIMERGQTVDAARGLTWEVKESLRVALYFLAAAPVVFLLGLVPFVGPILSGAWAARALSFQLTEPILLRRGMGFAGRRAWHRGFRPESMGFGLIALLVLIVPCANLLLVPALVVGGTRLVLELPEAPAAAP